MKKTFALLLLCALLLSFSACNTGVEDYFTNYTATFFVYISNSPSSDFTISSNDLAASQTLTSTYITIIMTDNVLRAVVDELDVSMTTDQLRNMIRVEQKGQSEIIQISVVADTYDLALEIANKLCKVVPEKCAQIVQGSTLTIIELPKVTENVSVGNLLH